MGRWLRHLSVGMEVIDPYSRLYFAWLSVIASSVLYNFVCLVFRSVFWKNQEQFLRLWMTVDYLSDAIYAVDMVVRSKTGYLVDGILVRDWTRLRRDYMATTTFRLDVLSLLPTDLLFLFPPASVNRPYVRLNRLLRAPRLVEFIDRSETRSNHPFWVRSAYLLIVTLTIIHWNACLYMLISEWIGIGSDGWVYQDGGGGEAELGTEERPAIGPYVYSLFWSTLMLLTIGNLPPPVTNVEIAFVTVDFLIGVLLFAAIIGSFSGLIASMKVGRTEFQQKADAVKRYMKTRGVSNDLQTKVSQWFEYMWTDRRSMDEDSVLDILPETFKAEIATEVHMEVLKRVSIFESCERDLLAKLVVRLRSVVYSPGDYVCHKGDIGTEMYIVKAGLLSVVSEDGQTVYATITDGGFFGEVSLLNISGNATGNRRVADVVSIGFSDIFILAKDDLWKTLEEYPDAKEKLLEAGKDRLRKGKMYNERTAAAQVERRNIIQTLEERLVAMENKLVNVGESLTRVLVEFGSTQKKLRAFVLELEERVFRQSQRQINKELC